MGVWENIRSRDKHAPGKDRPGSCFPWSDLTGEVWVLRTMFSRRRRCLHVPRRMILGDVQGLEIIIIQFDFRPLPPSRIRDREIRHISPGLRTGWRRPCRTFGRKCDIHPFLRSPLFLRRPVPRTYRSSGKGLLDSLHSLPNGVCPRRHIRNVTEHSCQQAFSTEIRVRMPDLLFRSAFLSSASPVSKTSSSPSCLLPTLCMDAIAENLLDHDWPISWDLPGSIIDTRFVNLHGSDG